MSGFESAVIGATASSLANIAVYPLDLVKTIVQTQLKEDGDEEIQEEVVVIDEGEKDSIGDEEHTQDGGRSSRRLNRVKPIPLRSAGEVKPSATVAAAEAKADSCTDTDSVSVSPSGRKRYKGSVDALLRIYQEEGIRSLYRGLGTSITAGFLQSFSYFFWYTFVRKYYFRVKLAKAGGSGIKFTTVEELSLGIMAAAMSQLFVNPVNVLATAQQTRQGIEGKHDVVTVAKEIYNEEGSLLTFWRGLKVSLVLTVNPAITYASYEKLKDVIFSSVDSSEGLTKLVDTSSQLSAGQNFILGVLSKIVSTVLTQPLIVAKASLQRSGSRFSNFGQVLAYLYTKEGVTALWKGLGPQVTKGVLVQGLLFMFKGELTKLLKKMLFYLKLYRMSRRINK